MNWLRLDGFDVGLPRQIHDEAGRLIEVQIDCVPTSSELPVCCLAPRLVKNGTKTAKYRDLRIEAAPTWLHVSRQRWKCQGCGGTLYQPVPHMDEHHMMTERLRETVELSSIKRTFRDTVAVHGVEEKLARRIFRSRADRQLLNYRFDAPRVLGIDENHLLGAARGVIVDVESGKLLDIYEGRTQSDIRRGFDRMDRWENVEVWCQDMAGPYKGIARDLFPNAAIVIDKFHVLTKANHWFTKIRVAETPKLSRDVRERLPGLIRIFDMHWEQLSPRQQVRLAEVLAHSKRLSDAWAIKEAFYYWYDAPTRADAERAYTEWVQFVRSKDQMTEWQPLMKMVQRWRKEIFNYFDHRYTSGVVERMNRSIADINRAGNGMDFQTLRAKALLRHGRLIEEWHFKLAAIFQMVAALALLAICAASADQPFISV